MLAAVSPSFFQTGCAMAKEREILVTEHALIQYQQRKRNFIPYSVLEAEIRKSILDAFADGRVKDHRPKTFMLYGRRSNQLPAGQRFALNEDGTIGWIIQRESGRDVVMTTLTKTGVNR